MKVRLSGRLSPQAKKLVLAAAPDRPVRLHLQVAPAADRDALAKELEAAGATVGAWLEEPRLLAIEAPAASLERIAELPGVVYVDAATAYRR